MFEDLRQTGIVPVISINDAKDAASLAKALYEGGLHCAEITFRTSAAKEAIRIIRDSCPEMTILAGTVLKTQQADDAMEAGASIIVAPGLNPKLAKHCSEKGYPYIPGICTPSEIETAMDLGFKTVKFFPAEASGGVKMLEAMHAPYRDVTFMPTGGISLKNAGDYLEKDYILCVGGSWIAGSDLIDQGRFDEIRDAAKEAAELVSSLRR